MADKDADLSADFTAGFIALTDDTIASIEVELGATPNQSGGSLAEDIVLLAIFGAEMTLELGATPSSEPAPPGDVTPPVVTNFSPAIGNAIENTQVIEFDVTDETGLAAIMVLVSFPNGTIDVVHDNNGFRGSYVGDVNARAAIVGGFHYTVRRVGGWPDSPTFEFLPVDTSGNIGAVS